MPRFRDWELYSDIDISVDDFYEQMDNDDLRQMADLLANEGIEIVPTMRPLELETSLDEDPANVLSAILWLRAHGFTVEPTHQIKEIV